MGFRIADSAWVARQAALARTVLEVQMETDREYTPLEIRDLLAIHLREYTTPEWNWIRERLVEDGVLVEV